ncbi:hypothetical protein HZU73_00320 [Apis mellifera caucasica]|nr:hypothetical protein HZU73_00320 [Apis mellifera caucasica]KAG9435071.1 hypothetical protein HZU67_03056 [Apis mellifera carnica]
MTSRESYHVGCAPPVGGKTTPFFYEWKEKKVARRFDLIQGESVDPFCASDQDDVEEVHEIGEGTTRR